MPWNQQAPVIRVSTNLVNVPVSVTDPAGRPVLDLAVEDFVVQEDGKPQPVIRIAPPGKTPIELALLFDVSASVRARFEFEQEAAARFLREVLRPEDAVSIFLIGPRPECLQPRTSDVSKALQSLARLKPTAGATAFFDSVVFAAHSLHKEAPSDSRKVQIVLSDGEDNHSETARLRDALRELQQADSLFYSINPSGSSIRLNKVSLKAQEGMAELAAQTGGAAFVTDNPEELGRIFARISTELQTQYALAYYAPRQEMDGEFRRITVRVDKRPELLVRARQGYYALPH